MKTSYDVLGVTTTASADEIRTAYLKRVKVLHPDRFDKATQPSEWQMANEMLKELIEAYDQLRSMNQSDHNAHSTASSPRHNSRSSNPASSRIDQRKTQGYWDELGRIYIGATQFNGVALNKDNFEQHLASLNQYVGQHFQAQLAFGVLDGTGVDPLVSEMTSVVNSNIMQISRLITERITLLTRAKYLTDKYPFWKTLWQGWQSMGISPDENKADRAEYDSINLRLLEIGRTVARLENEMREQVQCAGIQLVAKYGNSFKA